MYPSCTLCISTYNWHKALCLCLNSVLTQTILPNEIIIGDDGSTEETTLVIQQFQAISPVPIIHVWQPDDGFQLARIRNKSFAKSTADYLIQIDGDLILHPNFVANHLQFAMPNKFIAGTKALLPKSYTNQLLESGSYQLSELYNHTDKKYNAIYSLSIAKANYYIQKGINQSKYVLGANMSFWKKDILKVNGYNEDFTGWGKEDNELAIRLNNAGVQLHFLKFSAIVYHLYHKEVDRSNTTKNTAMLQAAINNKLTKANNGIIKY